MFNPQFAWQKEPSPPKYYYICRNIRKHVQVQSNRVLKTCNQSDATLQNTCRLLGIRSLAWLLYKLIEMMKFADVFNALNERFVSEYAIGFTDDRIPYLFILFSLPTVTVVGMPSCWHRPVMQYLTSLMGGFLSYSTSLQVKKGIYCCKVIHFENFYSSYNA